MSQPCTSTRARPSEGLAVEISRRNDAGSAEAFIEGVRHCGANVKLDVLLADGRDATACVDAVTWEWLELRAGDIVAVRHLSA
jgi:hypothetical protein